MSFYVTGMSDPINWKLKNENLFWSFYLKQLNKNNNKVKFSKALVKVIDDSENSFSYLFFLWLVNARRQLKKKKEKNCYCTIN